MKKKVIFGIASSLFALAMVFNMNLLQGNSIGDVSLESISVMAQAQNPENAIYTGTYKKDEALKNWKSYTIKCTYGPTTTTQTTNSGGSYNQSFGASLPIPGTPINVSASSNASVNYNKTTTTKSQTSGYTIEKVVCGSGAGWCLSSAPSGNPCN
ncbi:MAG TPA: hypothetical protein VLZ83_12590 [Edaphocola sp.]|nr:hypothetical protein [Edaphocola sp.]